MTLAEFDSGYRTEYTVICGVDEAGRGPLADVFAAAVVFLTLIQLLKELMTAKINRKKREMLFDEITEKALFYSIQIADVQEIERINILNAAMLAMKRAVESLEAIPDLVLLMVIKSLDLKC